MYKNLKKNLWWLGEYSDTLFFELERNCIPAHPDRLPPRDSDQEPPGAGAAGLPQRQPTSRVRQVSTQRFGEQCICPQHDQQAGARHSGPVLTVPQVGVVMIT